MVVAVVCSLGSAVLIGFIVGYQCSRKDCLKRKKDLTRTPSALSRQTQIPNQNGCLPNSNPTVPHVKRTSSKLTHINAYEATPKFNGSPSPPNLPDPVSLVLDLDETTTAVHNDKNLLMLNNNFCSTLPKDYKVKKMYL